MPGRKPKPPAVKRATGNPGHRPIREAKLPATGPVSMPGYLRSEEPRTAVDLWNEYAPALLTLGTLRKESESMFGLWCSEMAMYELSPKDFNASRLTQIRSLASSLGMDPSSQGKFSTPQNGDKDPADQYFTGPQAVG